MFTSGTSGYNPLSLDPADISLELQSLHTELLARGYTHLQLADVADVDTARQMLGMDLSAPWHDVRVHISAEGGGVQDSIRGNDEEQAMANAHWNWPSATRIEYLGRRHEPVSFWKLSPGEQQLAGAAADAAENEAEARHATTLENLEAQSAADIISADHQNADRIGGFADGDTVEHITDGTRGTVHFVALNREELASGEYARAEIQWDNGSHVTELTEQTAEEIRLAVWD